LDVYEEVYRIGLTARTPAMKTDVKGISDFSELFFTLGAL